MRKHSIGTHLFQPLSIETSREEMAELLKRSEPLLVLGVGDWVSRMLGYHYVGDLEKSLQMANYALNLNPSNETALNSRIYLLAALGRGYEAASALNRYDVALQKRTIT